ncbi:glycosyl transferase family 2 [Chthoniobacter flavus Ellin428]|uniref:Glycosyl transferase family 2 n=1 Tax=Chthoniobacter flavus Ellin428 TaxID=497964 RepID=B4CTS5_9BACT|nr:glycosyl transferase family 2 [Chthoniobacter flavus Ellin428]TCO89351.1 glycosyltransferase involved in cell wall biosynthesis [Chthoniobacter flavus]
MEIVKFSIVTPSFRQLSWLKRCARSVADQGVDVEHIVQDAGTGPELEAWAGAHGGMRLFVESDNGMYQALNRGLARATGDICAWLNCDEQYLPGALARVERVFAENPGADLVAGDFLVLDPASQLLAFRKITPLRRTMILTDHLYAFTCAIFFRRHVFGEGMQFDESVKTIADGDWIARALARGHRFAYVREYLSAFTFTGDNQSAQQLARAETARAQQALPRWVRALGPALRGVRRMEKLFAGAYRSGPIEYQVYAAEDDKQRTHFRCAQPQFRYPTAR